MTLRVVPFPLDIRRNKCLSEEKKCGQQVTRNPRPEAHISEDFLKISEFENKGDRDRRAMISLKDLGDVK